VTEFVRELDLLTRPPVDLEVWLLLAYAVLVLGAARVTETIAAAHFRRARRFAEHGFDYDASADHYHCPHGKRLSLHVIASDDRVAVYRAPASACARCPSKAACTPHDEGRHIYRPLAEWAETDVGRFHQGVSLFMAASGAAVSLLAALCWWGRPGTGLLAVAFVVSAAMARRDVRRLRAGRDVRMADSPDRPTSQALASPRNHARRSV
jgi:hypothetical protein